MTHFSSLIFSVFGLPAQCTFYCRIVPTQFAVWIFTVHGNVRSQISNGDWTVVFLRYGGFIQNNDRNTGFYGFFTFVFHKTSFINGSSSSTPTYVAVVAVACYFFGPFGLILYKIKSAKKATTSTTDNAIACDTVQFLEKTLIIQQIITTCQ